MDARVRISIDCDSISRLRYRGERSPLVFDIVGQNDNPAGGEILRAGVAAGTDIIGR
jgi:hypothetical protein